MTDTDPILETRDLYKYFDQSTNIVDTVLRRNTGKIQAVDGVSISVEENEIHGLIGESGCGKSTLAKTMIGLHSITDGEIRYNGANLSEFSEREWKDYHQNVQMIFQDPFNSLNPKMTIRESIRELLEIHNISDKEERVREALSRAQLRPPEKYLPQLPRELSGGEKQRASIARALAIEPNVLLADEPVSMLDVSTQAAILNLLSDLKEEMGLSILYVSHDISTVASLCDKVHVMYLGKIVESAPTKEVITNPKHPYTQALIQAVPRENPNVERPRTSVEGSPRTPVDIEEGCRFRDRCPDRMEICEKTPESRPVEGDDSHITSCHLYYDHEEEQNPNAEAER